MHKVPPRADDASKPILPARLKRDMPLVPAASIAGRALVIVIAIMTFLASLTAGAALLVIDASEGWRDSVSREITVQVRPAAGRELEADAQTAAQIVRAVPEVADVAVYSKRESEQLLEPWLGTGLDLGELPVPRLIVVKLKDGAPPPDLAMLRKALVDKVPGASLDDHRAWLARLGTMADTLIVVAAVVFLLVIVAMAFAVAFATRGAMAGNREIIDVLHFVGAEDRYIAAEFRRHFLRLGLEGGALGALLAVAAFGVAGAVSAYWAATPSGDQLQALFGSFLLGWRGYAAIVLIGVSIGIVTGSMSRSIVFRHLRGLH
jgi:cell division transport system permease protein